MMEFEYILLWISSVVTVINLIGTALLYSRYLSFLSGAISLIRADQDGTVSVMDLLMREDTGKVPPYF